ncbi:MAG: response regulator [Bacteroidetes bacterium]|nr:MAG: response regulator [Bacteroidota bacterium]
MISKINLACLIDDDSIYTYTMERMLSIGGYCNNLIVFKDGEEALEYFKSITKEADKLPDVIFLDVNMPVMGGWEFLEEFTKLKPTLAKNVTIYVVSSSVFASDIEKAKSIAAVSDYIIKPITVEHFDRIFAFLNPPTIN